MTRINQILGPGVIYDSGQYGLLFLTDDVMKICADVDHL
jgi:hypothetical protein